MVLTRFRPILQKFTDHRAEFIVVGGIAALVHAAPIDERRSIAAEIDQVAFIDKVSLIVEPIQ